MFHTACEYEKYFDLEYEEEEYPEYEEEESFTTAPTSLPLGPPAPLECNPSNPDKSGHRVSVDSGVGSFRPDMIPLQRSSTGRSSGDSGKDLYSILCLSPFHSMSVSIPFYVRVCSTLWFPVHIS